MDQKRFEEIRDLEKHHSDAEFVKSELIPGFWEGDRSKSSNCVECGKPFPCEKAQLYADIEDDEFGDYLKMGGL